ncbi:uncharacterized protein [Hemitrygon akajei]|uniref:uncharacterized protein isoform X3 n=1 Tax=Hemitrygon akajei TaxID=2704970 RepID=UPI003BF9C684
MSGGFTLDREQRDPWPLTPQTGALMARLKGPNWVDKLPWVLLGIRTAPKEDLRTSSAELVYGAPLVIPGEFIPAPRGQEEEPAAVLSRLRERLGNLAPIPTSQHGQNPTCVPKDLRNSIRIAQGSGESSGNPSAAAAGQLPSPSRKGRVCETAPDNRPRSSAGKGRAPSV